MTLCTSLVSIVPYWYFLFAAAALSVIVAGMLLFIFVFLHFAAKRRKTKEQLRLLFSDLIAEISIAENLEELQEALQQFREQKTNQALLTTPFARKVLSKELVKTKDSMSGKSADNLRWLYGELALEDDCFRRFQKGAWHQKAGAIQHLAEMQQSKYLVKIYRETNNTNSLIRTEAQIAVVKLTGFKGLRFLNIVSHPVSQWQQLSLLNHLHEGDVDEEAIKRWLLSDNDSVVEFALRLVEVYNCYSLHDVVTACLQHNAIAVRLQALHALKEIYTDTTPAVLLHHFPVATRQEQLIVLQMLNDTEAGSKEVSFLTSLLQHEDEAIRFRAVKAIQKISPAWSSMVVRHIKDHPQFSSILSLLQKQAV